MPFKCGKGRETMRLGRFVLFLFVLLVPSLVAAEPLIMNLGFRLNTFDAYEFAGGILQPTGNTAMEISVFGNHGSIGGEFVSAYIVSGEALWTSTTVYCRPKWRYMFAKSHIESYSKWKQSELGVDIGLDFPVLRH